MAEHSSSNADRNGILDVKDADIWPSRTIEELLELGLLKKRQHWPAMELFRHGRYTLLRYRVYSEVLDKAAGEIDASSPMFSGGDGAILGIKSDDADVVDALIAVTNGDTGPVLFHIATRDESDLSPGEMLHFLSYIDMPACWRGGADLQIAKLFDCWYSPDAGGWEVRDPVRLVVVPFERICFSTAPIMRETVDISVLPDEDHDLNSSDPDVAYWSRYHYQNMALEQLMEMPQYEPRQEFSSWLPRDPYLTKVVGTSLDNLISDLNQDQEQPSIENDDEPGLPTP